MSIDEFLSSFGSDNRIFEADIKVGKAHVIMLAEQDIIENSEAREIINALNEIKEEGFKSLNKNHEDIHPSIEEKVIEKTGENIGGKLHTARSRNDEVATCIRMRLREDVIDLLSNLLKLRKSLLTKAEKTGDWVVPGYTHLQRAQPTTMGHWILSYERAFKRDTERVLDCFSRLNISPLGSAAFAGTGFPIDRELTSELLGFDRPMRNSMDGVAARDFAVEIMGCTSNIATNISRLSEDIIIWNTQEFGFIELSGRYASSSSIMPQKKNPDTAELSRGKAGSVQSSLFGVLALLKGLPMSYNRDLQEATQHIWRSLDITNSSLINISDAIETASFNEDRMKENVDEEICATEIADLLARKGVPFRTAYKIVGETVKEGKLNKDKIEEKLETENLMVSLEEKEFNNVLDPSYCVDISDSLGGPGEIKNAFRDVKEDIGIHIEKIESLKEKLNERNKKLSKLEEKLNS